MKRVCELQVGDVFLMNNLEFKVTEIKDGRIFYYREGRRLTSFGVNNQMKVLIREQLVEIEKYFE